MMMRSSTQTKTKQTESKFIKHVACPDCGSSDGNSLYDDNHTYCHVCLTYTSGNSANTATVISAATSTKDKVIKMQQVTGVHKAIPDRGISQATVKAYSVDVHEGYHLYPYADVNGHLVAAKRRNIEDKTFTIQGNWKDVGLFGQQMFNKGGKYVTIVEGELDALAAYQMLGSKYPVVSIRNGASGAVKDCKAQYEWLDSFENIVISFDNDEPGKAAAREVAELFGSKAKIVTLHKHKDACEYSGVGDVKQFIDEWWAGERYVPDGIIAGNTLWELVNAPVEQALCQYPWEGLNKLTYGIRDSELVTVTAGSGLGKSLFLREVVYHVLKSTEDNIGLMFLEESIKKTARSLMSMAINKPLHIPDNDATADEIRYAYDETLGTDRLFLFDHFGSTSIENIVNRVRFMAKGLNCKYIVVDHISIIVSSQEHGDERRAIDEIMTRLRMLVQETGIVLFCVSHLKRNEGKAHEEGAATSLAQLRGSGAIAQLSDIVIGLERHGQALDITERNTTHVRVLKNRPFGLTGPACDLLYNHECGRLSEIKSEL